MTQRATLTVVAPHDKATRMLKAGGWKTGRSNRHTITLHAVYPTEAEAHTAGRRLTPLVWAVERGEPP